MSLAKSVPDGLKPQECECTKLCEPPPVPYVPTMDEVQEEIPKLRNLKIKTTFKKDTALNFLVWHEMGPRKQVQYEQEGHDANGHVIASYFVGSNQMHLHLREGRIGIFQKVFQQVQERGEMPWYQFFGQGFQESPF